MPQCNRLILFVRVVILLKEVNSKSYNRYFAEQSSIITILSGQRINQAELKSVRYMATFTRIPTHADIGKHRQS